MRRKKIRNRNPCTDEGESEASEEEPLSFQKSESKFGLVRSEDFFEESEVGLVEFDGFEVELSFLSWVLIVGKFESVVGLMNLVLFLGNEILDVSLRNSVWFLVELSMVVLVWFGFWYSVGSKIFFCPSPP